jgi:hypothetical protein
MKTFTLALILLSNIAYAHDVLLSPSSPTPNPTIVVVQTPQTCEIIGNAFVCH